MPISQFTPQSFPLGDGRMIIAPYWADVDTTGTGVVWYRETTEASLLTQARNEIQRSFINQRFFEPTILFIATWDHVGYFSSQVELVSSTVPKHKPRPQTFPCFSSLHTKNQEGLVNFVT